MKKVFKLVVMFLVMFSSLTSADTVGYIDMNQVLANYGEAIEIRNELEKKREEFAEQYQNELKKIEKARQKNKSEKEIEKISKEIEVKLIDIDERSGKLKLSRKVLLPRPEKK